MINIDTGKEVLREIRSQIYRPSVKRYPNINYYIGKTANTLLRQELLTILNYLINPQKEKNDKGEIEQRFFTAFNQYCFYLDTNAYTSKIRNKDVLGGRERSNHGINLLCALGFFQKEKDLLRYKINQNFKDSNPETRLMSIYHFKRLNLDEIELQAERLHNAKITVGSISAVNLKGAGLEDIAEEVYFRNMPEAYDKKFREFFMVLNTLDMIVSSQGYATKQDIYLMSELSGKETEKVLRAFRKDFDKYFRYGRPRNIDKELYDYQLTKWLYTRK